ncbi:hypothetical protein ES332_D10G222900v1 [Gossypium tomentosum]|uniref:EF-hand domain-containing protein n=1 Tax=Gossypium tomentosum TaxID=34277 RepID=A0A5D2J702_GOSTO|nr:hypothetical protein ES332_D10G222900v1 [Gossypium tomentosum]
MVAITSVEALFPKLKVGECVPKSHLLPLSSSIPQQQRPFICRAEASASNASTATATALEQSGGGKMVVELVGAFNQLTQEINVLSSSSSRLLFKSLKLSIPILQALPHAVDGRPLLSKALSLALLLAHLQMDAEVISAGLLIQVVEAGAISIYQVRDRIGIGTAHLLHESLRLKNIPSKVDVLDLDTMRHLDYLPRYQQQMLSLEVLKIYSPLAHAVGTNYLSLELEDLSFRYLFPYPYLYVDTWLRSHETGNKSLIDIYKEELLQALKTDPILADMVNGISVKGRYKSRYSTMKKLLRDGRKPEEVNDVLGLRVILNPRSGIDMSQVGERACYRTHEIVQSLWKEMPHRTKDYIARPKANGYKSLHMAVDVSDNGTPRPLMEIQIRTTEMDMLATGGTAAHSLYKGGLTDPEEAKRLKTIMIAAAELAALQLKDFPSTIHKGLEFGQGDEVFRLLDKNGDGKISIEELMEVMEELGASGEDAREMMQLLDSNSDGSLSTDEFDLFQKQVEFMRNLEDKDVKYKAMLNDKLQLADNSGLIQVYSKEFGDRLAN